MLKGAIRNITNINASCKRKNITHSGNPRIIGNITPVSPVKNRRTVKWFSMTRKNIFGFVFPYQIKTFNVFIEHVLIFIGSAALLTVKGKSDKAPENSEMSNLDYPFTVLLFLTGLTGVIFPIILGFPEWVMFFLLHDAFIFVIFLMAPFSKFIHPVFRYLSLLLNRIEETADI